MKVLVTGGAGFIGSHLVDALLKKNHQILVLDNFYSGREKNLADAKVYAQKHKLGFEVLTGDTADKHVWSVIPHVDAVFHVAAQTSVTVSVQDRDKDFAWNIVAAKNLIDFILEKKVRHLIYTNTAGALYGVPSEIPTPETHTIYPTSPYGATKSFLETYVRALSVSLKMERTLSNSPNDKNYFSWASLRLGNVYGPRQMTKGEAGVVPIFIEKFLAGTAPVIFGSGNETRDYVHVEDVVSAHMKIFELQQGQAIDDSYNVGTGVETKTREVFDSVKSALHDKAKGVHQPTQSPLRPGELEKSCLDIRKLKKLGWTPTWDFKSGVEQTVKEYLRLEKNL